MNAVHKKVVRQVCNKKYKKLTNALTQSRTEDRYITSVAPYQLGHKSFVVAVKSHK